MYVVVNKMDHFRQTSSTQKKIGSEISQKVRRASTKPCQGMNVVANFR